MDMVSRRTLLLAGGALALAGCAKPPVNVIRPTASPTGTTAAQLSQLGDVYGKNTDLLGIAVRDLRTGRSWDFRGDWASQSASMAKVMIAALALKKARSEGHDLDFDRQTLMSRMLIDSDNDAADALWPYGGGADAYAALARDLGMTSTHRDENRPDWSWTWTTPKDQLVLLDRLLNGSPAFNDNDRLYELDVMAKTNATQIWGVGHNRGSGVQVQMKNGWVQFGTGQYPGMWAVNSMGHVHSDATDYTAAMMTRAQTFDQGKALLDAIGEDIFKVMSSGRID